MLLDGMTDIPVILDLRQQQNMDLQQRTLPGMMYEILIFIDPEVLGDCNIEQPNDNPRLERPSTFLCT
jgi:hypothetical protein